MSTDGVTEILRRLDRQDAELRDQSRRLERIERHAELTNGRVTKLELARARWEGAKAAMGWVQPLAIAVVSGGLAALVPLLIH